MLADIGTRRGATLDTVSQSSEWINGYPWMCNPEMMFPCMSTKDIKLSAEDVKANQKEQIIPDAFLKSPSSFTSTLATQNIITERLDFSRYVVNPNKYGWQSAIRTLTNVYQFIHPKMSRELNQAKAYNYFFIKATEEVKMFTPHKKYSKISTMKDNIMYYTGRILPCNNVTPTKNITRTMLDLTSSTFFVPIIDRYSLIAFSIVNFIHWDHPTAEHTGVETVYRYATQIAYIIDARDLIRIIRRRCERCRYLTKRTIEVEMGPVSNHNLNLAPPFYSTQVDLCGPFNTFSNFYKRTTVKIWMAIFFPCSSSPLG